MILRQIQQIQLALNTAKKNEENAAVRLHNVKQRLTEEEQRLQTLLRYQREYQEKVKKNSLQSIQGALYYNQQMFIKNIEGAVNKQYQQVDKYKKMLEQQVQFWYSLKTRTQILVSVIAEMQNKIKQKEEKRDQQSQDELVEYKRRQQDPN